MLFSPQLKVFASFSISVLKKFPLTSKLIPSDLACKTLAVMIKIATCNDIVHVYWKKKNPRNGLCKYILRHCYWLETAVKHI